MAARPLPSPTHGAHGPSTRPRPPHTWEFGSTRTCRPHFHDQLQLIKELRSLAVYVFFSYFFPSCF